jgi:hypothetical protein
MHRFIARRSRVFPWLLVVLCLSPGALLSTAHAQSSSISVSVDRGNGATYNAGDSITVCVSLNLGGPNIFQASSYPVRLTDVVIGNAPVELLNTTLSATGQRCLTSRIGPPFGSETITGQVSDPVNGGVIGSASVSFTSIGQFGPVAPGVQLNAAAASVQLGQPASFTYSAQPSLPGGRLTNLTVTYGDGSASTLLVPLNGPATGTTSYTYTAPGSYTATLQATDATGGTASNQATVVVTSANPPPPPASGPTQTYAAGWNLIGVPAGTSILGQGSPFYTWQAGSSAYGVSQVPQPGLGYWMFLGNPTTVTLPFTGPQAITTVLPPGQFVMVGNPGSAAAILTGADVAFLYDPINGYQQTTQLPPGAGAWVYSATGGILTITSGIR